MPGHRANRETLEAHMQDLSSLSSTLARVQRITSLSTNVIARKIGFAIGLELASGKRRSSDVYSELATLFRRLSLGKITLRKWDPVVFVTHNDPNRNLETVFGEGVLEGIMHVRTKDRLFLEHSASPRRSHANRTQERNHEKIRRVNDS